MRVSSIAVVTLCACGCATTVFTVSTVFQVSTVKDAATATNAFGFDLYRTARKNGENFVCSPAGAAIALAMAASGARGETLAEMLRTMHIRPENLDQGFRAYGRLFTTLKSKGGADGQVLDLADRVWVQRNLDLRPEFVSLLREAFLAAPGEADFETNSNGALDAINAWSSEQTRGRIPKIIDDLDPDVLMVLANAIYLMADWRNPFSERDTYDGDFAIAKAETAAVRMMRQVSQFRYAQVSGAKLIELPYKNDLSMLVVLPQDVDGLKKVEDRLGESYADWMRALKYHEVDLELPRFTMATELDLGKLILVLGIVQAFGPRADFSGMTGERRLFISKAVQKAWIGTNEKGTEATAVTAIVLSEEVFSRVERPPPPPLVIFHADHPFLFLIRDTKSGGILFLGRMVTPIADVAVR